ncbi:MAG: DUF4157 domain-containing protein [Deltaproteobacteria bacterium]|nr:MAG: DUF4157 domain-containing protein [Deltaproteobacteria bacterium]
MELGHRTRLARTNDTAAVDSVPAPGKHTLAEQLPVQRREGATPRRAAPGKVSATPDPLLATASSRLRPTLQMLFGVPPAPAGGAAQVHAAAARGTATPATRLPYADQIQRAFGRHDISGIQAHVGSDATASARAMGAQAYATGGHVVLGAGVDLHTVAHEAAHVVQQRAGVQLKGGVGAEGDEHERHADAVADAVVGGRDAEPLLDRYSAGGGGGGGGDGGIQLRRIRVPDLLLQYITWLPQVLDTQLFPRVMLERLYEKLDRRREIEGLLPPTVKEREEYQNRLTWLILHVQAALEAGDYQLQLPHQDNQQDNLGPQQDHHDQGGHQQLPLPMNHQQQQHHVHGGDRSSQSIVQGMNKSFAQVWTPGEPGDAYRNALSHFTRHGTVGGQTYNTVDEYVVAAHGFIRTAQESFAQHKKGKVQIFVTFDRPSQTGVMLVQENSGLIASYYNLNDQGAKMNGHGDVVSQLVTLSGYNREHWLPQGGGGSSHQMPLGPMPFSQMPFGQTPLGSFSTVPSNTFGQSNNNFGPTNNDQGGGLFGSLGSSQPQARPEDVTLSLSERQQAKRWLNDQGIDSRQYALTQIKGKHPDAVKIFRFWNFCNPRHVITKEEAGLV